MSKINWQKAAQHANSEVLALNSELLEKQRHWQQREVALEEAIRVGDSRLEEMERRLQDEHHDLRRQIEVLKSQVASAEPAKQPLYRQIDDLKKQVNAQKDQYLKLKEQKDADNDLMKRMKQRYSEMVDERARERNRLEETGELAEKYLKGQENIQTLSQLCALLRHLTPKHYETVRFLLDEANGRTTDLTTELIDNNTVGREWEFVKLQVVENYRQLAQEMDDEPESETKEDPKKIKFSSRGNLARKAGAGNVTLSRLPPRAKGGPLGEDAFLGEMKLGVSPDMARSLAGFAKARDPGYFTFRPEKPVKAISANNSSSPVMKATPLQLANPLARPASAMSATGYTSAGGPMSARTMPASSRGSRALLDIQALSARKAPHAAQYLYATN
jgi:hypothetical protein